MRVLKLFGVSWSTYQAKCQKLTDLAAVHESVVSARAAEIRAKFRFEEKYNNEKRRANHLEVVIQERQTVYEKVVAERDRLVSTNRNLGNEIARLRAVCLLPYASDEARKLALRSREVWPEHLAEPSGASKTYTLGDVTLAAEVARRDTAERPGGADRGEE